MVTPHRLLYYLTIIINSFRFLHAKSDRKPVFFFFFLKLIIHTSTVLFFYCLEVIIHGDVELHFVSTHLNYLQPLIYLHDSVLPFCFEISDFGVHEMKLT